MANMATLLKQEISRLARKEVKAGTQVTRRAAAQYRRDIAELKRQVGSLSREVAYLKKQDRRRVEDAPAAESTVPRRFSADGLRKHRERLGVSAADYASLLGVSGQTVYNWEQGKARPRAEQLQRLAELRALGKREAQQRIDILQG
jgi:DNA-binding transcriptional regulator YiaG